MKKHAAQPGLRQQPVEIKIPVLVVPNDWIAGMGQMDTNLMGAPGLNRDFQQTQSIRANRLQPRGRGQMFAHRHERDSAHRIGMGRFDHPYPPLPIGQQVFVQRLV